MSQQEKEQPTIAFLYRRAELMPDGSIGAIFIGEFAGDRSKDIRLTIAQAKTLREQIGTVIERREEQAHG